MKLLLVGTQAGGNGGIQMVTRHLAAVFAELGGDTITLNDPLECEFQVGKGRFTVSGHSRNKVGFAAEVRRRARDADLVFMAHPHLAPLAPFLSTRVAVLVHGKEAWRPLGAVRRAGLMRADAVGAVSAYSLEQLIEVQRIDPVNRFILPPALDPSLETDGVVGTRVPHRLLTVARLDRGDTYKGIDRVLTALPRLTEEFPDVDYVVVGDGDDRARLMRIAQVLDVDDRVEFMGSVDNPTLQRLYSSSSIYVMPSPNEGFGIVYLEALTQGLAVIASDAGAAREVLGEGKFGLLVDDTEEHLVAALQTLLRDEHRRSELARAGERHVEANFLFTHFEKRVSELVDRLVS
jgi:glycosyltransferase involved in cell wall biosynthesis